MGASRIKLFFSSLSLIILSSIFYSFSFPGLIFSEGIPFFGWITLIPIFLLFKKENYGSLFFFGFVFGVLSYLFSQYWLLSFHPIAFWFVAVAQGLYFVFLFPLLKFVLSLRIPGRQAIAALCWVAYEFIKSSGFLAYPFGVLGYSQYNNYLILQTASVVGVFGISFFLIAPQVWFADILFQYSKKNSGALVVPFLRKVTRFKSWASFFSNWRKRVFSGWKKSQNNYGIHLWLYLFLLSFAIFLGFLTSPGEVTGQLKVALVQSNAGIREIHSDTFELNRRNKLYDKYSRAQYEKDYFTNARLTKKAMKENPDLVVWSETSFVPGIFWYSEYDRIAFTSLISKLKTFNQSMGIPLITGNSDGRKKDLAGEETSANRIDYNAAVLLEEGEIQSVYRKQKLVPFTEKYPFGSHFPWLRNFLHNYLHCNFWESGENIEIFDIQGVKVAVPICYEDGFGEYIRDMKKSGADLIINITNDSWSGSSAAQQQHLALSVFRAVENRRPILRSAQSGVTCSILPSGRIEKQLKPFQKGVLNIDASIYKGGFSFYSYIGDLVGKMSCIISGVWIILILSLQFRKWKIRRRRTSTR